MAMPKGFKHSQKTKDRISATCKKVLGTPEAIEANRKRNLGHKNNYDISGKNNPMYGKHHSKETKAKIRKKAIGRKVSEETRRKLSKAGKGKLSLDKHPLWRGGVSYLPYSVDWNETLRRSIRERDKYSCQLCGALQGDKSFCVHHIDYKKDNSNPDNLITLCNSCHSKTNNKYRKEWIKIFTNKINGNKS